MSKEFNYLVVDTKNFPESWKAKGPFIICGDSEKCARVFLGLQDAALRTEYGSKMRKETISGPDGVGLVWIIRFDDSRTANFAIKKITKNTNAENCITPAAQNDTEVRYQILKAWSEHLATKTEAMMNILTSGIEHLREIAGFKTAIEESSGRTTY